MIRKTREVNISVEMDKGGIDIKTDDNVLTHLLRTLFFYMERNVTIKATGDLPHHLWEDTGITIAEELKSKIKKENIKRFGNAIMPMDDALIIVAVDISRAYLNFDVTLSEEETGFEKSLAREFLWGFARTLPATVHIKQLAGFNAHHIIEASFKGLGKALKEATGNSEKMFSTKGRIV